jgi:small-conductance mechanosensitive channel
MKAIRAYLIHNWQALLTPCAILIAVLFAGWLIRRFLFRALARWASKTKSNFDDLIVKAVRGPFMIWVLILAVHLAVQSSDLPARARQLIARLLLILWIISATALASKLSALLVRRYGGFTALPVTTLTQNIASLAVAAIGLLILLNSLGVSITPILTALGVGGLAVALALQDTLSNLFAGFYVSIAGQVRPGDYIQLDTGQEGYVTDITWRSTTLRGITNNIVVVPNSKLGQAIVTNYHLPDKRMALRLAIGVSYDSDPDVIERVLIEEATAAAGVVPGLLAQPAPIVRFMPGFGDSSLNFTLICQIGEFVDQYLVQHELRKRIFKRFRAEGIDIPFPIRTVYLKGDSAASAGAQ